MGRFFVGAAERIIKGTPLYYVWVVFLLIMIAIGIGAYVKQMRLGLIVTGMTSYVSWGLYIGNFTFLVGVAAAAVSSDNPSVSL